MCGFSLWMPAVGWTWHGTKVDIGITIETYWNSLLLIMRQQICLNARHPGIIVNKAFMKCMLFMFQLMFQKLWLCEYSLWYCTLLTGLKHNNNIINFVRSLSWDLWSFWNSCHCPFNFYKDTVFLSSFAIISLFGIRIVSFESTSVNMSDFWS